MTDDLAEFDHVYKPEGQPGWGWPSLSTTEPTPPGLMLHDTLLLRACMRISKVQGSPSLYSEGWQGMTTSNVFGGLRTSDPLLTDIQ